MAWGCRGKLVMIIALAFGIVLRGCKDASVAVQADVCRESFARIELKMLSVRTEESGSIDPNVVWKDKTALVHTFDAGDAIANSNHAGDQASKVCVHLSQLSDAVVKRRWRVGFRIVVTAKSIQVIVVDGSICVVVCVVFVGVVFCINIVAGTKRLARIAR
jgi:hypothetical protein